METTIDNAFVKQFEREVHEAFQRMGSKLRGTVRNVNDVKGASTVFQKVGKGTASTKSTHGMVPVMNLEHTNVECLLEDYYAGDWVDRLDELKIAHDERQVIADAGAYALGRKTDEMIINALDGASQNVIDDANAGLTLEKVLDAFEILGEADVADDGQRFAIIGWKQWSDLLSIEQFANADYVGDSDLPWKGVMREWLGTTWIPHSGLPVTADGVRSCFWFHKTAVGHASGSDVKTDISWHGDRASHFVNNDIIQVCHKPYQFSCWNKDDPNYKKLAAVDDSDLYFATAKRIARRSILNTLAGNFSDPTNGATHYHAAGIDPYWARNRKPITVIGRHIYYKLIEV